MTEMLRSGSVMTRAAMGRAHTTAFGLFCFASVAALATRFASEPPGFRHQRERATCPKTSTSFDPDQHLQIKDVKILADPFNVRVRLKRIKQDQRMERPEARAEEGDWIILGDVPGDAAFSLKIWLQRFYRLKRNAPRHPDSPFFMYGDRPEAEDPGTGHALPLTYSMALRDFRNMLARTEGAEQASLYGLHSLRVSGYNACKAACGTELAVAQGGWHSTAHERYERFAVPRVIAMPHLMVQRAMAPDELAIAPTAPVVPPARDAPVGVPPPARDPRGLGGRGRGAKGRGRGGVGAMPSPTGRGGAAGAGHAAQVAPVPGLNPPPLLPRNCVGRAVLCPREMWPTWACPREHGGAGWEARIEQHRTTSVAGVDVDEVRVVFVNGRRPFQPMWLQLRALRPL